MRRQRARRTAKGSDANVRKVDEGCLEPPMRLIMAALFLGMIVGAFIPSGGEDAGESEAALVESAEEE